MFKHSILRHLYLSSACVFAAPAETGSKPAPAKSSVPNAGKSPFAHLARGTAKAADDDDKDDKKKDAAKDDGEEDDEEDDDKKSKKAKKKADDGDDDSDDASAEEGDDDKDDKKKSKKSKKADDGDDDDGDRDDDDDADARAARARERGRIRAIVTSDAGKLNPVGAMELACGTSMSRNQAIGTLRAMGVPAAAEPKKTDALRSRMAGEPAPDVGAGDAQPPAAAGSAQATAAAIIAAGKKARGEKA
jgi:hypothetical protein